MGYEVFWWLWMFDFTCQACIWDTHVWSILVGLLYLAADNITGSIPRECAVSLFQQQPAKYKANVFWWFLNILEKIEYVLLD